MSLKFKLRKSVKTKWLKALRSGEYKQARSTLRKDTYDDNGHSYCCLGVLCDIHRKTQKKAKFKWNDDFNTYLGENGLLPEPVSRWAFGLKGKITKAKLAQLGYLDESSCLLGMADPKMPNGKTLVELNDRAKLSFKQIANVIEKHL